MRSVSRATWTSGDPVSLSWVPYSATISDVAFITRLFLVQRGIARNGTTFLYPNPTRRQLFRPGHVAVHLLDERFDRLETQFRPQPVGELDGDDLSVRGGVEVEDERLDEPATLPEGGAEHDVDRGGATMPV